MWVRGNSSRNHGNGARALGSAPCEAGGASGRFQLSGVATGAIVDGIWLRACDATPENRRAGINRSTRKSKPRLLCTRGKSPIQSCRITPRFCFVQFTHFRSIFPRLFKFSSTSDLTLQAAIYDSSSVRRLSRIVKTARDYGLTFLYTVQGRSDLQYVLA